MHFCTFVRRCYRLRKSRSLAALHRRKTALALQDKAAETSIFITFAKENLLTKGSTLMLSLKALFQWGQASARGLGRYVVEQGSVVYFKPPVTSRSPKIRMARWPKMDKWGGKMYLGKYSLLNDITIWRSCSVVPCGCVNGVSLWSLRRDDYSGVLIGAGGTQRSHWSVQFHVLWAYGWSKDQRGLILFLPCKCLCGVADVGVYCVYDYG